MVLQEFSNFKINRIITHEIFQRNEDKEIVPPLKSDILTSLNDDGKKELAARIVEAVGQDSKSVEMNIVKTDKDSVSSFSLNIIGNITDDNIFIEMSKKITDKLTEAQISRNLPGGIVVIIDGTTSISNNNFVAIIKAELQGGFQKAKNNTIEFVRDLLLTPQQKLYKIGVFLKENKKLRAFVYDHNMSKSLESGMAAYFYETFLGCNIAHTDKFYTNRFYYETKNFINESNIFNDNEKFDLHTHLYSYLKSVTNTISITDFANTYVIDEKKKDVYTSHMQEKIDENAFNRSFTKDITDINSKLKMRKLTFSSKVRISAPSEEFEKNVKINSPIEQNDGSYITKIEIVGKINNFDK
jgi:hypothetical protein